MTLYAWLKAFHVIAVIAWMAGLLMLPRFYAYQTGAVPGGELDKKMIEATAKLRKIILTPALVLTWIFGLSVLWVSGFEQLHHGWMHAKLFLVLALSGLHGFYVAEGKPLARGERRRTEKFWRMINEVPFLIAMLVVILVIVKPF